ncbi:cytochrome-dependent sulfide dehydrogenase (flavoprotein) [Rhodobacter sp. JA431]|uniref:NAD(P)/FAD-dependent oxidoreductase n=1 Tax=Rhodobacter sp. JA431 TaxID=570013 RepID=UPI000BDB3C8F|nr:NAD(P)/FAD-dependent oxidoreductase [Rhodobacter sp. JA431]SOC00391.1 cytochrome-dependent sulfide dehydrogenase (flavoprotein) [Rhodobacter sp. JA431]
MRGGLTRRRVLAAGAGLAVGLAAPTLRGQGLPRVLVIGGGAGGASCARTLAEAGGVAVTLLERAPRYTTCFFSNHVIGGLRPLESLQFGYEGLARAGVQVVIGEAVAVERSARLVRLATGEGLVYDRLVVSPGIDFVPDAVPGWSEDVAEIMPHAWKAGPQTLLLKRQIEAMPEGGTFALIAPPAPYRCPPAPYERVSMIAHRLKQVNPTAKILIFDPKDHFSKQTLFENGWGKYTNGMVTWFGPEFGAADIEVRPETMEVLVEGEAEKVDVCNVIPAQQAGKLAHLAGLTDATGWAPVDPFTMRSLADPNIWVLGDASAQGAMPKGAFAAHSQAQMAAAAIRRDLFGAGDLPDHYSNICWSVLAPRDAVKLGGIYMPRAEGITQTESVISAAGEDAATRQATYEEAQTWYGAFTQDIFG